jgi:hypothetical protein
VEVSGLKMFNGQRTESDLIMDPRVTYDMKRTKDSYEKKEPLITQISTDTALSFS